MAVTDLTGTKWLFNETLDSSFSGYEWSINFVSNDEDFDEISTIMSFGIDVTYAYTPDNILENVYLTTKDGGGSWTNEAYRTIEITGGTDVTDSTLISWLQANATQITEPSNPISFGNLPIANMYFGTQQVKKVYLGNTLVWEKEETATIISFTINSVSYQAEEGMTWGEWVASQYNTGGYLLDGTVVIPSVGAHRYVTYNGVAVSSSEGIVAERAYVTGVEN